jgi:hypothetical protein
MVKTNFTQDGIGRSLSEPLYLPFSRLKKRQVSHGAVALRARLAGREGVVSPFFPDPLPCSGNLAQACCGHVDKRSCRGSWLARPEELDTGPNIRSYQIISDCLLDWSVRSSAKGSPCGYGRNRSRDAEHFTRPRRRKSSQ